MSAKLHTGKAFYAGLGGNGIQTISLDGELRLNVSQHDTTDDMMLNVSNGSAWVDIEMTFDEAERMAGWIIEAVTERRSPEGQAWQQEQILRSQERARTIDKS